MDEPLRPVVGSREWWAASTGAELPVAAARAALVGVGVGHGRAEVSVGLLFADPGEEGLELGGLTEGVEGVQALVELFVGIGGVELFVAGFAEGGAVFGAAAALFGFEVVEGDEVGGDGALTEGAARVVRERRAHARNGRAREARRSHGHRR